MGSNLSRPGISTKDWRAQNPWNRADGPLTGPANPRVNFLAHNYFGCQGQLELESDWKARIALEYLFPIDQWLISLQLPTRFEATVPSVRPTAPPSPPSRMAGWFASTRIRIIRTEE